MKGDTGGVYAAGEGILRQIPEKVGVRISPPSPAPAGRTPAGVGDNV
jgi:hypothetical protein